MASSNSLVFIHGWGTSSIVWRHQVEYFANRYKVETPELTGQPDISHQSPVTSHLSKNPGPATGDRRPATVLIGWSYGGMLSLEMAAKEPRKFKALVLTGTSAKFCDEKNGMPSPIIKKIKKGLERNFEKTMKDCYGTFFSEGEKDFVERFIRGQTLPDKRLTLEILDKLIAMDLKGILKDINIPALVIHGDKDEVCPVVAAEQLHRDLKGSRIEILKGAGHAPFYTRAEEFNIILEDFIGRI